MNNKLDSKVTISNCRLSYCNVLVPTSFVEGTEERYRSDVIISKSDEATINAIKKAIGNAIINGQNNPNIFGNKDIRALQAQNKFHSPLKDGDTEKPDDEAYSNSLYLSPWASKDFPPAVFGKSGERLYATTPEVNSKIYSGVYAAVIINFWPYQYMGKYGVGATLIGVLSKEKGEAFNGSRVDCEKEFSKYFEKKEEDETLKDLIAAQGDMPYDDII